VLLEMKKEPSGKAVVILTIIEIVIIVVATFSTGILTSASSCASPIVYPHNDGSMPQEEYERQIEELKIKEAEYRRSERIRSFIVASVNVAIASIPVMVFNTFLRKRMSSLVVFLVIHIIIWYFLFMSLTTLFARAHAPIIYLYPEEETEVNVTLSLKGKLTLTDPVYDKDLGWTVTASPDGTLTCEDKSTYPFLFWEGILAIDPDMSQGYCVKGEDTAAFLESSLSELGLSDEEAGAFICYWLPMMEDNDYNVISFQNDAYEEAASLYVSPSPDTVIRVNMMWYASDAYVDIPPQDLSSFNPSEREGFTVVEWGGEMYGE